ncbi:MAG: nucleotide-binding universal stress UspA family protein [Cellvibrionaceae bacterium]|jgi:nucleotide-binding universal stress UspA family protein
MIKRVAVCLNNVREDDNAIQTAAKFALDSDAKLIGLYIVVDNVGSYHVYDYYTAGLRQQIIKEENQQAELAEKRFNHIAEKIGCKTTFYKGLENDKPTKIMLYTDLIFMSYSNDKDANDFNSTSFINELLVDIGRPVIVVPKKWDKDSFGKNILLGWSETRESARALHEALPLMKKAKKVDVVTVYKEKNLEGDIAKGMEVSTFLESHNVTCELYPKQITDNDPSIGSILVKHSDRSDIDLITVGGYGHSYLRESLLGGVTQHLISHARVPLMLVH